MTTSSISGRINDGDGAVVGAAVVATHVPSGTTYYSVSDKNGSYRLNSVAPGGPYSISVEMLGYRDTKFENVYAPLGENLTQNVELQPESIGLDVLVFTADATDSGMDINRSGATTTVSQKTMSALPTVGRTLYDVMKLTPQSSSNSSGTSIGGGTYRSSFVSVDGAAFQNSFGIGSNLPSGGAPISLDAIEQMTINITPFDVRQSGFTGGAINAVTKRGTNEWHASVYNYFTNDQLQGDRVVDTKLNLSKSLTNTTGVTVGGPIIKNKLFFFLNAEYSPETVPSKKLARPSESDEYGGKYNRPTEAFMNEVRNWLIKEHDYDPGEYQNYSTAAPDWKVMARVDWNIANDHKLNVRFSHTVNNSISSPSTSINPLSGGNMYNRDDYGRGSIYALSSFQNSLYNTSSQFTSLAAELNSNFLDGQVNNLFRVTWSHQNEARDYFGDMFPTVDIMEPVSVGESSVNAVSVNFGLDPFTYGNLRDVQTVIATDEVSLRKGINNIVAGLQFEWDRTKNGYMQMGSGYYLYNSWEDFKTNANPAAFAITFPNNKNLEQAYPTFDYMQASAYVQDELEITDNFKLTAGLRLELPFYPEVEGNFNADFAEKAATSVSFKGLSTSDLPKARLTVSPRVGFNWDILKDRSLILRGGTGIYTGRIPFVWIVSAMGNSNCIQAQYYDASGGTNIGFHSNVKDILAELYPNGWKENLPAPQNPTILDKNLRLPSTWKSSLALEGRLPGGIRATVEGIFNKDLTTVNTYKLGMTEVEGGIRLPGEPGSRTLWQSEDIKNSAEAPLKSQTINPYHLTNTSKDLNGYYYSVTAQLQKDFNFGLSLMAAYTHSDSWSLNEGYGDQVSSAFSAGSYSVNGSNNPELGHSGYVAPNRVIANVSYTIKEGSRGATTLGLFYEGVNLAFIGGNQYSYNRHSYVMGVQSGKYVNSVTEDRGALNLIYIPTDKDLDNMTFVDDANKKAYADFIASDKYLNKHRGEYSQRGAVAAPWQNRINFKVNQDINFEVAGKTNTIQLGLDINNVANLLNSNWGLTKQLSSETVLLYDKGTQTYTFNAPKWTKCESTFSTWSMLLSLRWLF